MCRVESISGTLKRIFPCRRSSVFGGGQAARSDPRAIGSKQFTQESVQRLITFLLEHEYPNRISPKILHSPTGRDFANIITFLFKAVDPNFELTARVEDTVPAVYKAMK